MARPKTGGRKPGSLNKKTIARKAAIDQTALTLSATLAENVEWFQGDAYALLRLVYTDPRVPLDIRIDAAKSVIKYERRSLSDGIDPDAPDAPLIDAHISEDPIDTSRNYQKLVSSG